MSSIPEFSIQVELVVSVLRHHHSISRFDYSLLYFIPGCFRDFDRFLVHLLRLLSSKEDSHAFSGRRTEKSFKSVSTLLDKILVELGLALQRCWLAYSSISALF